MTNSSDQKAPLDLRAPLLAASLPHIGFDGWTVTALNKAAADLNVSPEMAELAFPEGGVDMITQHLSDADADLDAAIRALPLDEMKIRDKITQAIRLRLEQHQDHKDAVAKGIAFLALPMHSKIGAQALWATAGTMWKAIGDTSTDHNYYTKRMTLSAVYSAVLTFWLNDTSDGHSDTYAFLDRRIEDVMKIEKAKYQMRQATARMPSLTRFLGRLRYPSS